VGLSVAAGTEHQLVGLQRAEQRGVAVVGDAVVVVGKLYFGVNVRHSRNLELDFNTTRPGEQQLLP